MTTQRDTSRIDWIKCCCRAAGASVVGIGCLVLAGWVFGALSLNSAYTALALAVVALIVLFASSVRRRRSKVSGASTGCVIERRFLPAAIVIPAALNWLRWIGQQAGLYTTEFGLLLMVLLGTATLVLLIRWNARLLARLDAGRKNAEQALAERERLAAFSVDVSRALTQCHTLEETLRSCAEVLVRHFDAALVQIWTLEPPGSAPQLAASAGLTLPAMGPCQPVPVGKEKIDLIAQSRQPLISYEVIGDDASRSRTAVQQAGLIGFAGYPLIVEEHFVGVLAMFARNPFSSAAIQAMTSVSNGVALGIERKRTEESLREQATHDPLTGLWNRSAILELLRKELARAARAAAPISLVMVDLDHFKRINDERGHLIGDVVLRCTGEKMVSFSRPYDMIGRYGGEEFVIVLPGCDAANAIQVAERIRTLIGRDALDTPVGPLWVTVSMGVASLTQVSEASANTLIQAADAALYRAKKLGRNRVELAAAAATPAQFLAPVTPTIAVGAACA